jgi:ABC-type polysaccharide/polyol phosphate export permease
MLGAIVDMGVGIGRWRTSAAMAFQDIELRYKRSVLGPFWISASLVATMLALAFVFAEVFRQDFVEYIAFLGAGLLAWQLVLALVTEGCGAVIEHSAMLQNLRLPQSLIAGRLALRNAIIFVHNLVAVVLVLLMFGVSFSPGCALGSAGRCDNSWFLVTLPRWRWRRYALAFVTFPWWCRA